LPVVLLFYSFTASTSYAAFDAPSAGSGAGPHT
jgi:hypothetical protein